MLKSLVPKPVWPLFFYWESSTEPLTDALAGVAMLSLLGDLVMSVLVVGFFAFFNFAWSNLT